jgi:hypothetical protein
MERLELVVRERNDRSPDEVARELLVMQSLLATLRGETPPTGYQLPGRKVPEGLTYAARAPVTDTNAPPWVEPEVYGRKTVPKQQVPPRNREREAQLDRYHRRSSTQRHYHAPRD